MITILTHMYRVRAILALLLFLSSASLWAQSDDATLTNITTLEQLDAIRYDLNGYGVVSFTTADPLAGSPMFSDRAAVVAVMGDTSAYAEAFTSGDFYTAVDGIVAATGAVAVSTTYYYKLSSAATSPYTGYELMNNLDFEDADGNGTADDKSIWAEGATAAGVSGAVAEGWAPIGYYINEDDIPSYTATFDGRGHTISNLYTNRTSANGVGLFGALGRGSNLRNLGIEGGSVTGAALVGGLVGRNGGTISACYATGNATGTADYVGGLVGGNFATISACYATGNATGEDGVGGLVGRNSATISACYALGDASGGFSGGLVGFNESGTIRACYATGNASGHIFVEGLVGLQAGTVTNSYFDTETSGIATTGTDAKTTAELQTPTAYGTRTDIYANWNIDVDDGLDVGVDNGTADGDATADDPWDFGTDMQYPALKVDFGGNGTASVAEFGTQPRTAFRVSSFTPTGGVVGATVTIRGRLFSEIATDNTVVFLGEGDDADDVVATVSAATTTELTVTVPSGAITGKIQVEVNSVVAISSTDFTVRVPSVVSSFTPEMGVVGTRVTITGAGFSTSLGENIVTFLGDINDEADNQRGTVFASTATSLTVRVTTAAKTGKISVMVGTTADTSDASFTVTAPAPVVSNFTPTSGAVGATVMITGTGFSTTAGENTVTFLGAEGDDNDNVVATASTSPAPTATSLTVSVPTDAQTGKISVMVGTAADTSGASFTVTGTTPVSPFSVPLSSEGDVRLYPNPTSGYLHFTSKLNTGTSYKIYALVGKRVLSGTLQDDNTIDARSLPDGQYVLTLENKENTEVLRTRVLILK